MTVQPTTMAPTGEMERLLRIEGMMCPHCEATVKKTLEALPQVESAQVSWQAGTAMVKLAEKVEDAVLQQAIEAQEYQVTSIQ